MSPEAARQAGSLSSERALYARMYANSQDSVFLVSPDGGKILFANPRAVEDTTYELPELEAMEFAALFLPEDQAAINTIIQTTLEWASGTDPQRILKRKSGKKIIVEISALRVEFEGQKAISCTVRDITGRVKAEEKIRQYSKELEQINAELEDRVRARTQELAGANEKLRSINDLITKQKKELDDVMNNIQQAIFTISPSMQINNEYSKFAEEVFGAKKVAGADIVDFLFEADEREPRGTQLRDWLKLIFEQPDTWDMAKDFGIRELHFLRKAEDGSTEYRDLKFEWRPIYEGTAIAKIMAVCMDVTEQKRLEAEIARKDAEHREELELISQLINLPLEVVEQFISDFERNLTEGQGVLKKGPEGLSEEGIKVLMRTLHTIKGSAKQFRLQSIHHRAHEMETKVVASNQKKLAGAQLAAFHESIALEFQQLEKSLRDVTQLYEKVMHGKSRAPGEIAGAGHTVAVPLQKIEGLLGKAFAVDGPIPSSAVRKAISWLIQIPVKSLFDRLEQLAQSIAMDLEREVVVEKIGEEVKIDYRASLLLYDGFQHAIRNSIDHGGAPPDERRNQGKEPALKIALKAELQNDLAVYIEVSDDGNGIDVDKVKKKALEKKLVSAKALESATAEDVLHYVFLPGFSTRDTVTDISGRGVGLDVLKETAEKTLRGEVSIASELGAGARIGVRFPVDVFSLAPVSCYCLPTDNSRKDDWEKKLGILLRKLPDGRIESDSPVITDSEGLQWMQNRQEFAAMAPRVVCLGDMAPSEIVSQAFISARAWHFLHTGNRNVATIASATLRKLSGGPLWGLERYLGPGVVVRWETLTDYTRKNEVVSKLTEHAGRFKGFAGLQEILATIADEMIMNGMFDAPRDASGKPKYNHLPRTHALKLEPQEAITLRYAADKHAFALSVEDPFGALTKEILAKHVLKGYRQGSDQISHGAGGAGLGLFMIYDNANSLVVNVAPGKRTEVIALVNLERSYEDYQRTGKCVSFFQET